MFANVFPLRAILLQFMFLLMAIAIEGFIFHDRLKLDRKTSIQYAASINLFATTIGWLVFFIFQDFLPPDFKAELVSYVFFDRFIILDATSFNVVIVMAGLITFFGAFFVKLKGLELLQILLKVPNPNESTLPVYRKAAKYRNQKTNEINQATIVLWGNACTYSAILVILFFRVVVLNNFL